MTEQFLNYYDSEFANQLSEKFNVENPEVLLQKLNQCGVKYQKSNIKQLNEITSKFVDILANFGASEKNRLEYHSRLGMNLADVMLMINELNQASVMALKYFPPKMSSEMAYPYFVCWLWLVYREVSSEDKRDDETRASVFIKDCVDKSGLFDNGLTPVADLIRDIRSDKDKAAQIASEFGLLD
ncbi:MAG: hypothetical protein P8Y20_05475 [Gammaproteobacteria bacterium]